MSSHLTTKNVTSFKVRKTEVEELENKTTLRMILEKFLISKAGKYIDTVSFFLSSLSCGVWVSSTYVDSEGTNWFDNIDIVIMCYYLGEYALKLFTAQHRIHHFISYWSIIELFTIFPIIFINYQYEYDGLGILISISRITRSLRVVRFINKNVNIGDSDVSSVSRQIFTIFLTVLTLVFITAGVILTFEKPVRIRLIESDPKKYCSDHVRTATFHEMIYFVVVTLATVGYGDVTPKSEAGRVLMGMQSRYARAFYKSNAEVPHIMICGHVLISALKGFCNELFHPDHGSQDKNAVILQQEIPNAEMESFLHTPQYELFLTYLQGNPMIDRDLRRAVAIKAKACVILTNKYVTDSYSADHKNILTGLSIKKFVHHATNGDNIRLCMQLIKPESKLHYYSSLNMKSNDQLIVIEEFKMNLLAKSCFSPGIISMISNLITSAGDQDLEKFEEEWIREYSTGMGHEIYRTDLSSKFQGKTFSEIAAIIYNDFQGILFGIEMDIGGLTIIRLNPGPFVIPDTVKTNLHVYIICEDKKVADQVATYDMSSEEISSYHQAQALRNKKTHEKNMKVGDVIYNEVQNVEEEDDASNTNVNKIAFEENEQLEGDYILLSEPVSLMSVSPISLKDSVEVSNHIVVCGIHPSIYYFLLPLRASYLKELQYVVILAPEKPTEIWEYISRFPKIIYIKGSPLLGEDLIRANINYADKAVVLGQDMESRTMDTGIIDEMLDAESIFIYKAIKKCNKNVQIMVELVYSSNMEFLLPREDKKDYEFKYEITPLYAAGEVYISAIIDTLTCQSYFNPHIVTILQQILTGGKQSSAVIKGICDYAELRQSNLWQILIPEDYLNKTFGEMFNYLCVERHLIPLGLYRLPGAVDNTHAYCFTNPPENIKLTNRDKVFVLSFNMPNDLRKEKFFFLFKAVGGNLPGKSKNEKPSQEHMDDKNHLLEREVTDLKSYNSFGFGNEVAKKNMNNNDLRGGRPSLDSNHLSKKDTKTKGIPNQKAQNIDFENLNINSSTFLILGKISAHIKDLKDEINKIKQNIAIQDDQITEKIANSFKQELFTIGN